MTLIAVVGQLVAILSYWIKQTFNLNQANINNQ